MSRSSRTMRMLRWVGLAACLALLIARGVHPIKITGKKTEVWLHNSLIFFYQPVGPGFAWPDYWHNWKIGIANHPGYLPKYRSITTVAGKMMYISLPLELPLVFMVIGTSVLWRIVRRYPPGHCQRCGYDLTGNVTGVCSECATKVES